MENNELYLLFSGNLSYWLAKREKTQADLCRRMGVSSATVSDWCNGKKIPRTDKLIEITDYLMIDLSDLLYETADREKELDTLMFRLRDDVLFRETVSRIKQLTQEQFAKLVAYLEVLGN